MKTKKNRRKLDIKKLLIFILIISIAPIIIFTIHSEISSASLSEGENTSLYNFIKTVQEDDSNTMNKSAIQLNDELYGIVKEDNNSNYSGIGQEKIQGQDGYFTTFTTGEKNKKIYTEFKQNGTSSWATLPYWDGTMETDGCGITAMSIIISGYSKKACTPGTLREKFAPVLQPANISSELSSFGIKNSNFLYDSAYMSENYIDKHLSSNRPVLICVWNKPQSNRWTQVSHYLVLLATDNQGKWYVSNPNGLEDNSKSSGWYKTDEIVPYIAKVLFVEKY